MKERYEKPMAEKITFFYQEQVVAASGTCGSEWTKENDNCQEFDQVYNQNT